LPFEEADWQKAELRDSIDRPPVTKDVKGLNMDG